MKSYYYLKPMLNLHRVKFSDAFRLASAFGLVALILLFIFSISDILLIFLTALILAIALDRPIDKLVKRGIPHAASVIFIYLTLLLVLSLSLYLILPPLAYEIRSFAINFPVHLEKLSVFSDDYLAYSDDDVSQLSVYIKNMSDVMVSSSHTIFGTVFKIFGGAASFLALFFIALFLNIQRDGVRHFIYKLLSGKRRAFASQFFDKIQSRVSSWLWGKTVSSLIVGIIIFFGLLIMGTPYAVTLAILAVLLNFIPFAGPAVAAIPAILLAFIISPFHALAAALLYFVANGIIESFVIVPLFMKKAIKMNPALLILFVLIGGKLGGLLGIIISIPLAAIVFLIIEEYLGKDVSD